MEHSRLTIHQETLYKIINTRYYGISPSDIKRSLINSGFEFDIENPKEDSKKSMEAKKEDYINSEVSRAIKILSKKAKSKDLLEDYDDTLYFDEGVSNEQKEDYKYYSHSLIIGEAKDINDGKKSKRNATYRLNKNIIFTSDNNVNLRAASNLLYMQFAMNRLAQVDDSMVQFILAEKKTTADQHQLLVDTFLQISTHHTRMPQKIYSLELLLALASLRANVNLQIQTADSAYYLTNVAIDKLIFDTDTFDIKCGNIQFSISDLNDIKSIESSNTNTIRENIIKCKDLMSTHKNPLQDFFNHFAETQEMFFQDY
ncbi:MAG TPA: hypothetical protein PLM93_09385 [Sulfuricurvum sp.]|nr:hypothetical protein [Sulfuricurvum sp.]HQT37426.1 hypothetical protein [Sulfuricurvum sp.]